MWSPSASVSAIILSLLKERAGSVLVTIGFCVVATVVTASPVPMLPSPLETPITFPSSSTFICSLNSGFSAELVTVIVPDLKVFPS